MKKIFLVIFILFSFCSCAFAAMSDDVYVRKDLFEVYMQNINSNFEKVFVKLDKLDENMNDIKKSLANLTERVGRLEEKVDGNYVTLSNRIESVEKRFDDLRYDIYLIIGLLGVLGMFIGLPFVQKWMTERKEAKHKQVLTLEDVEKVFERMFEAKSKGAI